MQGQVRIVIDAIEELLDNVTRSLVTDIILRLQDDPSVGGTPVDTGFASSNWIASIGSPYSGLAGSREDAENGVLSTLSQQRFAEILGAKKLFTKPVHVTNNVEYINLLNDGSSRQAPAGFVQNAISGAVTSLGRKL